MSVYRCALALAGFVVLMAQTPAGGQNTRLLTLDNIKQTWRAREEKYHTAVVVCEGRQFFGKENPEHHPPQIRRLLVTEDHAFDAKYSFALDGDKMTYKQWGMLFNAEARKWDPTCEVYGFDGQVCKSLRPADENNLPFPQGMVYTGKYNEAAVNSVYGRPILLNFRPLHPVFGAHLDAYHISGKNGVVDGRECVLLERRQGEYRVNTLWLDPGRGLLFLRYSSRYKGITDLKLDVRYRQVGNGEWLPSGWDIVFYRNNGTPRESFSGHVTQLTTNETVDASEFQVEFPPGTWVTDHTEPSELGQHTEYIILPDGSRRVITRADLGKKYEDILAESRRWLTRPVLFALIAVMAAVLGLVAWKKWAVKKPLGKP